MSKDIYLANNEFEETACCPTDPGMATDPEGEVHCSCWYDGGECCRCGASGLSEAALAEWAKEGNI